jgi:hypothetical protein
MAGSLWACIGGTALLACSVSPVVATGGVGESTATGRSGSLCTSAMAPDGLILTRDSTGRVPVFLRNTRPFRRVSTRVQAIQRLYASVCSLRPPQHDPSGRPLVLTCNSWPVEIHLVFLHRGRRLLRLTAATGGCPVVVRAAHAFRGATLYFTGRIPFWMLVARAAGLRRAALLPYPSG